MMWRLLSGKSVKCRLLVVNQATVVLFIAAATLCGMCLQTPTQRSSDCAHNLRFRSQPHLESDLHPSLVRQSTDGKEYGADTLDPLLWDNTQHLLAGDSHRRALACLDEFLRGHGERALEDPLNVRSCNAICGQSLTGRLAMTICPSSIAS